MVALLLALPLSLTGCTGWPRVASNAMLQTVEAGDLRELLADNTLYRRGRRVAGAWHYAGLQRADGTILARIWWAGGEERASGRWEVTDRGIYCRIWDNHWGGGERGCFRVSRSGDTLVFDHVSGSRGDADRYAYQLQAGNSHGL